ncbi:MAG: hypothetical protein HY537_01695 [Deltaproteobacteria bacterium]|nr:hypothetical protein [Deltaproteobacteria bacterium]
MNGTMFLRLAIIALVGSTQILLAAEKGSSRKRSVSSLGSQSRETVVVRGAERNFLLSVGPGLQVQSSLNGGTGFAMNFGGVYRVTRELPIYVGLDNALIFRSWWSSGNRSVSEFAVQLLPTAFYRFDIPGTRVVHPYGGLSLGTYIRSMSNTWNVDLGMSSVVFEMLFRPGVHFKFNETFGANFEPKLGILDGGFVFLPTANATFELLSARLIACELRFFQGKVKKPTGKSEAERPADFPVTFFLYLIYTANSSVYTFTSPLIGSPSIDTHSQRW